MERNGIERIRKSMAAGVWLGVALGIVVLAPSGSNADDLDVAQPSSNGEEPAAIERANGDVPPELEVAEVVATTDEPESARPRSMIRFKNAEPRVDYGGLIERRMWERDPYRERIRHHGVYSSRHAHPDIGGRIRHSGAGTGRLARYHTRGRIRYDGVARASNRSRVASIREDWMGADRPALRFGMPAY